jgi:hypothetical protein
MMAGRRLFVRARDGRIEVRLNDLGREFVRSRFARLVAAQADPTSDWRATLDQPIDPSRDVDDVVRSLERQEATSTNAELSLITADEQYLSEGEGWAWLSSLQHILRAEAADRGIVDYPTLDEASPDDLDELHALQQLLFEMAEALN